MKTDTKEKIISLLNQTGIPFQDWCVNVARDTKLSREDKKFYRIIYERTYTWPPSNGPIVGNPGSIDFIAISFNTVTSRSEYSICLVVECKKADAKIKNWVFPGVDQDFRHEPYFLQATFEQKTNEEKKGNFFLLVM